MLKRGSSFLEINIADFKMHMNIAYDLKFRVWETGQYIETYEIAKLNKGLMYFEKLTSQNKPYK